MKVNSASARVLQQRQNSKLLRPAAKLTTLSFGSSRQDPKKAKILRHENKQTYRRKKRYQPIEHWLTGAPTDLLEKVITFFTHGGAKTCLLEKLIIFVTHGGPNCLLPEAGRKEPIVCRTVDKRGHSILNESLPKNHLLQVAICDKSYIRTPHLRQKE